MNPTTLPTRRSRTLIPTGRRRGPAICGASILAFALAAAGSAQAAAVTWSGADAGTNVNWDNPLNWVGNAAPTASSSLVFDGTAGLSNLNNFTANTLFNGITFNATAGDFVLAGNTINLGGNLLSNKTSGTQTINLDLALQLATTLATVAPGSTLTLGGAVTGASANFTKLGAGRLQLTSASNTYGGTTTINGGTLSLETTGVLNASSPLILGGGELALAGTAAASRTQTLGALTMNAGRGTLTLAADAAQSAALTLASAARNINATSLYRGTGLGGTAGAGVANIFFTAAPTSSATIAGTTVLAGLGSGTLGTTQAAVLRGALADTTAAGTGMGFATYDPTKGVRLLTAGEQLSVASTAAYTAAASGDNVRISGTLAITGKQTNTLQIDNTTAGTVTVTNTGTALHPSNGLLFTGTSAITLTGGSLTFNSGANIADMVILSTNTAGVTIASILANGGTVQRGYTFGGPGNITVNGVVNAGGAGAIAINGPGMVTLNAAEAPSSQGFTVNGGTLRLGSSFTMGSSRPFKVAAGATLETNGVSVTNIDYFDAINTLGGTINNASGTASTLTITSGSTAAGGTLTYPGIISGNINLVRNSTGTTVQALSGLNTYTGTTTVTAGALSVSTLANGNNPSSIGSSSNAATNLVLGGGTLIYSGSTVSSDRNFTVSAASTINVSDANATLSLAGATLTANTLTKAGSGGLTLTGAVVGSGSGKVSATGGTLTLQGATDNAFLGATVTAGSLVLNKASSGSVHALGGAIALNGGTLLLSGTGGDQIFNLAALSIGGGTLDLNGLAETTNPITSTGGTLASTVAGGVLSASSLSHSTGAFTINPGATFAGATTIASGSVLANGAINGSVTVNGGTLGGLGTTGPVTLNSGGHLAPGSGLGTLTVGTLSLSTGSVLDYEFGVGNDLTVVSTLDGLSLTGGGFNLYQSGGVLPFSTVGSYQLIQYSGALTGNPATMLSVLNPQAGRTYSFAPSAGYVTLTIGLPGAFADWTSTTGGAWGSGSNWSTNPTIPNGAGDTANFGSALTSPGVVTLDGSKTVGFLTFNNLNSYTLGPGTGGTLLLDNGAGAASVIVTSGSHTITAPVTLVTNTAVAVNTASDTLEMSGSIDGSGTLTKSGAGTLVLGGTNTHAGTVLNGGVTQVSSDANLGTTTAAVVVNNATLQATAGFASSRTVQLAGTTGTLLVNDTVSLQLDGGVTESGAATLNKSGPGTLILNGPASYTGGTNVAAGTLQLGTGGNTGTLGSGALTLAGTLAVNHSDTVTIAAAITGAGNLTMSGGGTLLISSNNSGYAGGVSVSGSTLSLGASNGAGTGTLSLNNATLRENNVSTTSTNAITVTGANFIDTFGSGNAMALNGAISGSGSLTRNGGTNTLTFGNTVGNGSFAGSFSNTSGNLSFTNKVAGSGAAQWSFTSGTVTLASLNGTISFGSLSGTSTINGTGNIARLNVGGLNIGTTYSGNLTGGANLALLKTGTAALTLSGANVMSGQALSGLNFPVVVANGSLVAAASTNGTTSGPLGGSGSSVLLGFAASGATTALLSSASLLTDGAFNLANPIVVSGGSGTATLTPYTLSLGGRTDSSSGFSGAITLQNNLTISQAATTGANVLTLSGTISGTTANTGVGGAGTGPNNTGTQLVTFAGPGAITAAGSITNGGGTVAVRLVDGLTTFSGNHSYTGSTTVDGGTLVVSGTLSGSTTTVNNGGTLSGTGTTLAVTINSGGRILADSTTLATGNLTLAGAGEFSLRLDSDFGTAGKITVNNLELDGAQSAKLTLNNAGSAAFSLGQSFTFIDYADGGWNGNLFAYNGVAVPDDSTIFFGSTEFKLSYNGLEGTTSEVTLLAVPEPGSALYLLASLGTLLGLRRPRRK